MLPLRPRDLEAERNPDGSGEEAEEGDPNADDDGDGIPNSEDPDFQEGDDQADTGECMTVAQCISLNQQLFSDAPPEVQQQVLSMSGACYRDVAGALGAIGVVGCQ
jgi:hypothetical protein